MHMILSENRPLRTATLCVLYVAQGIPYGFVSIALAAWLSEAPQSWELKKISFVMAAAISPWTFKWAWGPLLDTWTIRSCGRRRPWILLAQFFMAVTIGGMLFVPDLAADVDTLIALIFLHNIFASLQDVSVDALAVDLLESEERERVSGQFCSRRVNRFSRVAPFLVIKLTTMSQQIKIAADHREDVVEVVRQPTGELANGFHLLCSIECSLLFVKLRFLSH